MTIIDLISLETELTDLIDKYKGINSINEHLIKAKEATVNILLSKIDEL